MQAAIVSVLAGLVAIPLVNLLKFRLGWQGDRVKLLAGVVSGTSALVLLGVACVVTLELVCVLPLTLDSAPAAIGIAFTASQLFYVLLPKS